MSRVGIEQVAVLTPQASIQAQITYAINTATLIVDEMIATKGLSAAREAQIELYLAAHFAEVATTSGSLAATQVGSAEERYHNIYKAGLKSTRFGQHAILLDTTGTLANMTDQVINTAKKPAVFRVV